ncbi:universal stress protein [Pseudomonas sp. Marseille-Q5115]|uniref:universal stress protein n=1 Tax=Pseudomonas sp. Marseille-Q5115 TaxID=2866593 RepID=UPI001CE43678|nr:universal stress protein [Pseudomonas sp. Marseille-Q5115]
MADFERLLLIATPAMNRTPAFDRAASLAKVMDATLHIVAFDYIDGIAEGKLINELAVDQIRFGYLHAHRDWLEQQVIGMRHMGVTVTTEALWSQDPFEDIPRYIKNFQPSLVIKDLRHEAWFTSALFASLDLRLMHECQAPLHLIARVHHGIPRKILAAVDPLYLEGQFEYLNDRIVATAKSLAERCGAQLDIMYCYDLSRVFAIENAWDQEPMIADHLYTKAKKAFHDLAERFGIAPERRHVVIGTPAKMIESYMFSQGADVLVLGTVQNDLMHRLLGSTTEQVANHLYSSLLAINPRGVES